MIFQHFNLLSAKTVWHNPHAYAGCQLLGDDVLEVNDRGVVGPPPEIEHAVAVVLVGEPLIELLLQLRKPQIMRDFKADDLSQLLSERCRHCLHG